MSRSLSGAGYQLVVRSQGIAFAKPEVGALNTCRKCGKDVCAKAAHAGPLWEGRPREAGGLAPKGLVSQDETFLLPVGRGGFDAIE